MVGTADYARRFALFVLGLAVHAEALGQAAPAAGKSMDLSAFGGYSTTSADFYTRTRPTGFVFGTDITRYFNFPIVPSLEARVNLSSSPSASERTYLFGFRAEPRKLPVFPRVHPYGDILMGRGTVHFADPVNGYLGDNSLVTSFGGGVDFALAKNFFFKVDYQKQHWNTGEVTTHPGTLTFGVTYRIPFKPRLGQYESK